MQIKRLVFSFSIALVLAGQAGASYASLSKALAGMHSSRDAAKAVLSDPVTASDQFLQNLARDGAKSESVQLLHRLQDSVDLRAKVEQSEGPAASADDIHNIKNNPFYRDPAEKKGSNWLKDAMDNLSKLLSRDWTPPKVDTPDLPNWRFDSLAWLKPVVYGLIAAGLIAFLAYALRFFTVQRRLKRKVSAILEEDEPERTLDEWLLLADQLEAEGKYREAVRALYLASLLRFDEAGVARFMRGQTNWEHLTRIRASPQLPAGLDFTPATKRFDLIWYGFRGRGQPDIADFRGWYIDVTQSLAGVKAA